MLALVSPLEPVSTGWRLAQIVDDVNVFPVAAPYFWAECPAEATCEHYVFDPLKVAIVRDQFASFQQLVGAPQPKATGVIEL